MLTINIRIVYKVYIKQLIRKDIIVEGEKYRLFINDRIIKILYILLEPIT